MRVMRRLVHVLVIVLTLIIGAAAAAIIVTQTAWFKNWLRGYIVREANQYLNGTLSIERLGGNLFFGVEMENVGVSMNGAPVVAVKDLGLDYNVFELLSRGMTVDSIRLDKPVVYLRRDGDTWSLTRLVKKQETEANRSGPARPVSIDEVGISDGAVVVESPVGTSGVQLPKRFDHLDAKLSFQYEPVRYSVDVTHVSFRSSEPSIALNALSGGVSVKDDVLYVDKLALRTAETSISVDGAVQHYVTKPAFNLQISSDKLSIPEIARLVPSLTRVKVQPAVRVRLDGPLDRLGIDLNVRSSAGQLTGTVRADVIAPGQSASGQLSIRHLDLAPILNDRRQRSDITADARLNVRADAFSDLSSMRGDVTITAPRIAAAGYVAGPSDVRAHLNGRQVNLDAKTAAYGASLTASGQVAFPDPGDRRLRSGRAQEMSFDLRGQVREVDLRKLPRDLKVPPATTDVNAEYHVRGTVEQGRSAPMQGSGTFRFQPSVIAGARIAEGSTAGFTLDGRGIGYSADATIDNLDLQAIGREFDVPALADPRYKSSINGHIVAEGRGTKPADLDVTARGTLDDTAIGGGRIPQLAFDASLANDTAHVKASGTFSGFDPAALTGRQAAKGAVGGNLSAEATVDRVSAGITPDSVRGSARVNLQPSSVGGLDVSRAALDADYHDSTGDIRTLEVVGRDLNVRASGTLALNDTDQSNLSVHADSPSLNIVGQLINQPLTGIAKVDATVTGNRQRLQASGNFTGDGIKYGQNGALTASADFTAAVTNLDPSTATASATTRASFVTVAGQNINELTARTDYTQQQLDFDATARQPQRSLTAAGSLLLHPQHQEVHLRSLGFQSQNVQWQTPPDARPVVQYSGDAITIKDLRLVNGNQQISAEGTFGQPGEAIEVAIDDVDVATVDAVLLRPPQLSGRLNASASVSGTKENPTVEAKFAIEQGGFRQFRYDTFGGTVKYAGKGVDVDARLQQNPTTWLTATGFAPLSTDAPRNRYDLHIDSSAIDLGLVQGFTTALTNVTGTLQAKVDVGGVAGDPRPSGNVTIQRAAFTVAPTGVDYTDLDGRVDLQQDRLHIEQLRVVDNHGSPLTISGDLPIEEREYGALSIAIKSDDFKVIDNKMGNVRVNSDLRITGQVNAPRIEGDLGVSTGAVNLDTILAQVGTSAYATKETEFETSAADTQGQAAAPSAFDTLYAFVHLTVPNDLVVKADDLRTPGSPISFGSLNVTLGGDVTVHKAPYDQPRLYGTVNTVRGNYDFQGRRFEILRDGTVKFEGTDDLDPALDLKTQRIIQAVTANVGIGGTLKQPKIALSSVPPLDDADILSLIVFNQPINQLGEGQQTSLAARAEGLALGAAAGQLTQSIGSALNIDTLELNLKPESGGGPQVTIGEQVGQNLFVKIQQGIGDQSQTNFILEYELTKWLRFRTNVLQGSSTQAQLFQRMQGSGVDLLFFFSY